MSTPLPTSAVLLAKSVVGAGTAALPAVFAALGVPLATTLLTALTAASALSTEVVLRAMRATRTTCYVSAVRASGRHGRAGAVLLDGAALAFGWGMLVVYCGMVADQGVALCGGESGSGGSGGGFEGGSGGHPHHPPSILCHRSVAIPALAAFIFLPLSLARSLADSAAAAWAGAAAVGAWAAIGVGLVAWAGLRGGGSALHALPASPDPARLAALAGWASQSSSPSPPPAWAVAKGAATAGGLVTSAMVLQLTAPCVAAELADRTPAREAALVRWALALCGGAYLAVALPALALLGPGVRGDVLDGWTAAALAPAVGGGGSGSGAGHSPPLGAVLAAAGVRAAFAAALATMFPLMMWPTREAAGRLWGAVCGGGGGGGEAAGEAAEPLLAEEGGVVDGEGGGDEQPPPPSSPSPLSSRAAWFTSTAVLTFSAAATAVAARDAAAALGVIGSGAGAVCAFFVPAGLAVAGGAPLVGAGLAAVGLGMVGAVL
jgi:hypothetical protein